MPSLFCAKSRTLRICGMAIGCAAQVYLASKFFGIDAPAFVYLGYMLAGMVLAGAGWALLIWPLEALSILCMLLWLCMLPAVALAFGASTGMAYLVRTLRAKAAAAQAPTPSPTTSAQSGRGL